MTPTPEMIEAAAKSIWFDSQLLGEEIPLSDAPPFCKAAAYSQAKNALTAALSISEDCK